MYVLLCSANPRPFRIPYQNVIEARALKARINRRLVHVFSVYSLRSCSSACFFFEFGFGYVRESLYLFIFSVSGLLLSPLFNSKHFKMSFFFQGNRVVFYYYYYRLMIDCVLGKPRAALHPSSELDVRS